MKDKKDNIIEFKNKTLEEEKITDEDIKNLFLGLVKLVKNTSKTEIENDYKVVISNLEKENKNLKTELKTLKEYSENLFSENLKLKNQLENLKK